MRRHHSAITLVVPQVRNPPVEGRDGRSDRGRGHRRPALAYWLRQAGHHPTLVEQAPQLRRGGYLVDFWGAGFDIADRMGLTPELRRRGYVMKEARSVDRRGRKIASFDPLLVMGTSERYVSIVRSDLAELIFDSVQGRAELILGDSVRELDDDGNRVRVTFDRGERRAFDLVVGADGLHSRVRRLAFGPDE